MESPHTGTTVIAVTYQGGVVLGSDSRVSMGQYISNRASSKVTPLTDNIWLLRSGSAADAQAISDYGESTTLLGSVALHIDINQLRPTCEQCECSEVLGRAITHGLRS